MAFREAILGITICIMDFLKDSQVCAKFDCTPVRLVFVSCKLSHSRIANEQTFESKELMQGK